MADWNPQQYARFAAQRAEPFHDLLGMVQPAAVGRLVDLGCGPGELTVLAGAQLGAVDILGIDNSPAMLAKAAEHASASVRFEHGDLSTWTSAGDVDVVIAAASLQWVPDHFGVIERWRDALRPGGQLAIQVPANAHMPAHVAARVVAEREPYASLFGDAGAPPDPILHHVLAPEHYAQILYDLGFAQQMVRMHVYPHLLPSTRHVVEWVRGTMLTRFESRLGPDHFEQFVADYTTELLGMLGDHQPHFFPFRRVLLWGRLP